MIVNFYSYLTNPRTNEQVYCLITAEGYPDNSLNLVPYQNTCVQFSTNEITDVDIIEIENIDEQLDSPYFIRFKELDDKTQNMLINKAADEIHKMLDRI